MKKYSWLGALVALTLIMATGTTVYGTTRNQEGAGSSEKVVRNVLAVGLGVERVAGNQRLALDFNPQTAEIYVTDLESGTVWASNPEDRDEDSIAKGTKKMDLQAQLMLDYVDSQSKPFQINNYTGSIKDKNFEWSKVENGIEVSFHFPKAEMTIPVRYTVKDDAFSAMIVTDRIEQGDKYKLVNMSLLPFFGAGNLDDEGYMFVPDGSGALIRFNNNKGIYKSYNERVYGGDQALTVTARNAVKEDIKLPVYGLRRNDQAFLAVIHQGAYQAGITAEVSRKNNQYNTAYSYLNLVESESNLILAGTLNEKQVLRMSESLIGSTPYEVKYYFLDGNGADYAGMAGRYRQYLVEEQGVSTSEIKRTDQIPLLMNFLGGVKKRETFLGIPYQTIEALTSYQDVDNAVDLLQSSGVEHLFIRYEGWMSGGMNDKVTTSVKAESNLGSKRDLNKLVNELNDKGVAFYPVVDPIRYYTGGNGFHKFSDTTKGISKGPALQYQFRLSDGTKNTKVNASYLLRPEAVVQAMEKFSQSADRYGLDRVAFQSIGSLVYSDFRKGSLSKNNVGMLWEEGLKSAQNNVNRMMFDDASAYTFPYAESVSDTPLYSSEFDVEDESVPFYSIALSGLIPTFSEPINLSSDPTRYLLKLIETGTYPSYRFIARDGNLLQGTGFDNLYSGDFSQWLNDVKVQYAELNEALVQVVGRTIIGHEQLSTDVFRTTFDSGKSVIVNYTDETVAIGADRIAAGSYLMQ